MNGRMNGRGVRERLEWVKGEWENTGKVGKTRGRKVEGEEGRKG